MNILDLGIAPTQQQVGNVVQETNPLEVAGAALEVTSNIVQQKEKRDASTFLIENGSNLNYKGKLL